MKRLTQKMSVACWSMHKASRALQFRTCRTKMVQEIKAADTEKRFRYYRWFQRFFRNNINILDKILFSDEAWLQLSGYLSTQNSYFWATTNPYSIIQKPLHSQKIGLWWDVSRIVRPLFFEWTVDGSIWELIQQFIALLEVNERYSWFQHDNATYHTSNETMD